MSNTISTGSAVTALTAGAATITLTVPDTARLAHWFAGIEFYDDAGGTAADVVNPTAGTATFTVATEVLPNHYVSITGGVVTVTAAGNTPVDWSAPTTSVKCVVASATGNGATHCRVRVVGLPS